MDRGTSVNQHTYSAFMATSPRGMRGGGGGGAPWKGDVGENGVLHSQPKPVKTMAAPTGSLVQRVPTKPPPRDARLRWVGLYIGFLTRPCLAMYATPLQVPPLPFVWLYAADLIIWFCFDMQQPSQYRCGCGVLISNMGKTEREYCKSERHQKWLKSQQSTNTPFLLCFGSCSAVPNVCMCVCVCM